MGVRVFTLNSVLTQLLATPVCVMYVVWCVPAASPTCGDVCALVCFAASPICGDV